jgi:hypothetical protein
MATDTAYCPDITKPADIFCGYNMEPVVIFDIPRSRIDTMDHIYSVIEKFLNGMIFVGKYNSHSLCITPPHVIVFSNDLPKTHTDKGNLTLSADRWNIVKLQRDVNTFLNNASKKRSLEPETPSVTKHTCKRKNTDTYTNIMKNKDADPMSFTQTTLATDNAPSLTFSYKNAKIDGFANPTVFNKND